ncbi:winged helix-turn-helix domain-containing protein [Phytoactinopolyspora halotolerans]|uniref:Winged helix-turn-helix transcriptional regulator n=1 Tax=Phytoactinopolyspora halotolerans TaxID=1981512 RepID=A0A6L9SAT4_9ACTN|nr:winged helix-turn-helix domain-containing protein [Phytoactinopolyspora halotolerans]NEE02257.1 winged helix-turn-helix transcriptional regulator [Phytoactinopolyspora halotolerans]
MAGGRGAVPAGWPSGRPSSISLGGVTLDMSRRCLAGLPAGDDISLTPLQTAVLAYLMSRPGEVCTRQDLMCDALGYPNPVGSRTIDVHVATLRSKLRGTFEIRAVRGVGYALHGPSS